MTRNFSAAYRGKAAALREWDGAQESVRDTPWSLGLGIVQMETLESPAEFLCCKADRTESAVLGNVRVPALEG